MMTQVNDDPPVRRSEEHQAHDDQDQPERRSGGHQVNGDGDGEEGTSGLTDINISYATTSSEVSGGDDQEETSRGRTYSLRKKTLRSGTTTQEKPRPPTESPPDVSPRASSTVNIDEEPDGSIAKRNLRPVIDMTTNNISYKKKKQQTYIQWTQNMNL